MWLRHHCLHVCKQKVTSANEIAGSIKGNVCNMSASGQISTGTNTGTPPQLQDANYWAPNDSALQQLDCIIVCRSRQVGSLLAYLGACRGDKHRKIGWSTCPAMHVQRHITVTNEHNKQVKYLFVVQTSMATDIKFSAVICRTTQSLPVKDHRNTLQRARARCGMCAFCGLRLGNRIELPHLLLVTQPIPVQSQKPRTSSWYVDGASTGENTH